MTFARFMELALYCPNCGYYEKEEDIIGRRGDYYTSVSVGRLFGGLLAFQFAEWLERVSPSHAKGEDPRPDEAGGAGRGPVRLVEAGAHNGRLAHDILGWMSEYRSGLVERLEYWIVEPSDRRRKWQRRNLAEFGAKVRWVSGLTELRGGSGSGEGAGKSAGIRGIIFCNELLDAMATHRFGWDAKAKAWFEWGVNLQAGRFVWTRMPGAAGRDPSQQLEAAFPGAEIQAPFGNGRAEVLPDGFSIEVCPAAEQWWREAANVLEHGRLLAIDYGLTADELFMPEKTEGTLRAYRHHQPMRDVLAHPGEQDITAQVNFTVIRAAGESAGLNTDAFLTQGQFLTGIVARAWDNAGSFREWTAERTRQLQTLTHPEHLGHLFRVLVQSRA